MNCWLKIEKREDKYIITNTDTHQSLEVSREDKAKLATLNRINGKDGRLDLADLQKSIDYLAEFDDVLVGFDINHYLDEATGQEVLALMREETNEYFARCYFYKETGEIKSPLHDLALLVLGLSKHPTAAEMLALK